MITTKRVHVGYSAYWTDYYEGTPIKESVQLGGALVGVFLDEDMSVLEWIYNDSNSEFVVNCCHWENLKHFHYIGDSTPVLVALREIELLNDMRGY